MLLVLFTCSMFACNNEQKVKIAAGAASDTATEQITDYDNMTRADIKEYAEYAPTLEFPVPGANGDTLLLTGKYLVLKFKPLLIPKAMMPGEKQDLETYQFMQELKCFRNGKPVFIADISKELFKGKLKPELDKYGVLRPAEVTDFIPADSSFVVDIVVGVPLTNNVQQFSVTVSKKGKLLGVKQQE